MKFNCDGNTNIGESIAPCELKGCGVEASKMEKPTLQFPSLLNKLLRSTNVDVGNNFEDPKCTG
jgi:hypothetical protein